jgi:heat shock protein HslJ
MQKYLIVLIAGWMLCSTATEVSELSAAQGEWQLTVIERDSGTTSQIPIPARYTIVFAGDGRFSARADCNT